MNGKCRLLQEETCGWCWESVEGGLVTTGCLLGLPGQLRTSVVGSSLGLQEGLPVECQLSLAYSPGTLAHLTFVPARVQMKSKTHSQVFGQTQNFCAIHETIQVLGLDSMSSCKEVYLPPRSFSLFLPSPT